MRRGISSMAYTSRIDSKEKSDDREHLNKAVSNQLAERTYLSSIRHGSIPLHVQPHIIERLLRPSHSPPSNCLRFMPNPTTVIREG